MSVYLAVGFNFFYVMKVLLQHGEDSSVVDDEGRAAFDWACRLNKEVKKMTSRKILGRYLF